MHSRKAHTGPRVSPLSVPNCKDDATRFERRKDCFCCRTPGAVANDNYGAGAPPMNSPGSRRQQSLLDAVEFDHDGALHNPGFVDLAGRPRARKRPPDSRMTGPASFTYSASLYGSPTERNVLIQYAFGFP